MVLVLLAVPSRAEETNFFTVSPKLEALLSRKSAARTALSNACASAFPGRTVGLYYFYSKNEAVPRAYHFYPNTTGQTTVVICIRENQDPWDELFTLLFELLNSKGEKQFEDLCEQARAGKIAKDAFPKAVVQVEFEAMKATRNVVRGFHLSGKERKKSLYYSRFLECPDDFDGFLSYTRRMSHSRDVIKEYEAQYDELRKAGSGN